MFELRVLNGLHQGAALPLFGEQWSVGASADADLVLCDPGIAGRHISLYQAEQRWRVQAEEGLVQDGEGRVVAQICDLALDAPFSIGGILLCVAFSDQPWPQEPEPVVLLPVASPDVPSNLALGSLPQSTQKRWLGILLVIAILIAAIGMVSTDEREAQASLMPAAGGKTDLASASEVRQTLMKMLDERELSRQVTLQVINGQITLNGLVSEDELALLARMLDRFAERFNTPVPVLSRVRERNDQLPFKIVQIVSGAHGHVVLEEGRRLFLGDEVDGLRLVSIDNNKVIFDGQQRYEVSW